MHTWEELERFIDECRGCPLAETRKRPVMGRGSHEADIMFIAEAPGGTEDETGIPFTGAAGKVLDELLEGCGLTREEVYITNTVKCHPPRNRDPQEIEKERCFEYLRYETFLLRPKVIVCLGRVAAQRIISPDFRITRDHGRWTVRKNCAMTGVYHPSFILRDERRMEEARRDFDAIAARAREMRK